jgi:hypothetical protein
LRRVVSRHHHDDFFPEIHGFPDFRLILSESSQVLKPNLKYQSPHGGRRPPVVKRGFYPAWIRPEKTQIVLEAINCETHGNNLLASAARLIYVVP